MARGEPRHRRRTMGRVPAQGVRPADDHLAGARRRGAVRRLDRRRPQARRRRLGDPDHAPPRGLELERAERRAGRGAACRGPDAPRRRGGATRGGGPSGRRSTRSSSSSPSTTRRTPRSTPRTGARAFWDRQPPSYRRSVTHWVMSAKRDETRAKRLATLVEGCQRGERVDRGPAGDAAGEAGDRRLRSPQPSTMNASRSARARRVHGPGRPSPIGMPVEPCHRQARRRPTSTRTPRPRPPARPASASPRRAAGRPGRPTPSSQERVVPGRIAQSSDGVASSAVAVGCRVGRGTRSRSSTPRGGRSP